MQNNQGFSLIEVLVSMLILVILLLGTLAASLTAIDLTARSYLRDEAIKLAQSELEECRAENFDNLLSTNSTVNLQFRNSNYVYRIERQVVQQEKNLKKVTITVLWKYKGKDYTYSVSTLIMHKTS
ncbi:MAG: prepilin-type N-terminal cleavage/methylation domain-containing protein [Desulfonauticus sp.]|nr:prepilin-type N-terminal cleavage/methylation domain-containing protein [Desulfonauticus sp.]